MFHLFNDNKLPMTSEKTTIKSNHLKNVLEVGAKILNKLVSRWEM